MFTGDEKAAWLTARAGKLTASRMGDAMAFTVKGEPKAERIKLLHELLAERLTGDNVSHVVTEPMVWGMEHEDEAVDFFVELTGRSPKRSRLYEHPTIENFAATPDRELDDGLLEVKCPTTTVFLEWTIAGIVPVKHRPQMAAQLLCTGKKWCGFMAYDPRIRDENKRLFMRKYEPTTEELAIVEAAAIAFLTELDEMFDRFVTAFVTA